MDSTRLHKQEKYHHLVRRLEEQILSGELQAEDRLPTFADFQQSFGVTSQTVSRALLVLEQKGLIVRQRGRGVYVAQRAWAPEPSARRHHGIIGLCGWGFGFHWGSSSYWTHLLGGIRERVQADGSQILLLEDDVSKGWEKVDGVLLADRFVEKFLRSVPAQLPLVCLFDDYADRSSVVADEKSGIRLAVEHLARLGHKRIAYLHGSMLPARLDGYREALRQAGIAPRRNWRRTLSGKNASGLQFSVAGHRDMNAWLDDKGNSGWAKIGCSALLCHNDEVAIGAMRALSEAGLHVPRDVSVVGFDGAETGEPASRLTTVEVPLRRMGELAIESLQRQIAADEALAEHQILPTQLRVRQSTAAPPQCY